CLLGSIPTVGDYLPSQLPKWGQLAVLGVSESAWPALIVSLGLIFVSLLAACLVFERQEI
ncbi:MAG: hypothetical protein IBX69_10305, partial [Anaerolineales bacterium]|nr:hypothetical protein [Anaerolineales bacterium]